MRNFYEYNDLNDILMNFYDDKDLKKALKFVDKTFEQRTSEDVNLLSQCLKNIINTSNDEECKTFMEYLSIHLNIIYTNFVKFSA